MDESNTKLFPRFSLGPPYSSATRCRWIRVWESCRSRGCRAEQQQEQRTRDLEIDPHKYYPPDVYREPLTKLENPQLVNLIEIAKTMGIDMSKFKKDTPHNRGSN